MIFLITIKKSKNQVALLEETQGSSTPPMISNGSIIVVAKCPIPGKSKTRLIPLLGQDGSATLAKAMLSDVLMTLERCPSLLNIAKILLYAPGDNDGLKIMQSILDELGLKYSNFDKTSSKDDIGKGWRLLPMHSPNLESSELGDLLQIALEQIIENNNMNKGQTDGVVFLGMDSPELMLSDIVSGLELASRDNDHALLCPAKDGGYGMLCLPSSAYSKKVFQGVYWSHPLTAISQIKALTDQSIHVSLGQLMHDIDEPEDVEELCKRLFDKAPRIDSQMVLDKKCLVNVTHDNIFSHHLALQYTKMALKELNMHTNK